MSWKQRFIQAHHEFQERTYPTAFRDFGPINTVIPDVKKANGLTNFICKFITWKGYRATRVNVQGRLIEGAEKQESGASIRVKKWMKSTTRKGTADISATIKGRSVMIEVKVGKDKPRPAQLDEQEREERAGGIYRFIGTPDEFLELYDKIVSL